MRVSCRRVHPIYALSITDWHPVASDSVALQLFLHLLLLHLTFPVRMQVHCPSAQAAEPEMGTAMFAILMSIAKEFPRVLAKQKSRR